MFNRPNAKIQNLIILDRFIITWTSSKTRYPILKAQEQAQEYVTVEYLQSLHEL